MNKPFVKITMNEDASSIVEFNSMTPLQMTYCAMLLLDKVYEILKKHDNLELAEVVGSILQATASLVNLVATPDPTDPTEVN